MQIVATKAAAREAVLAARLESRRVALVPTMGYLHEGHLSLIDRAREVGDWVALTIFVNPLQFGPREDLARYPRDLERDLRLAERRGADLVFTPTTEEMYPSGEPMVTVVPDPEMEYRLCGASRPGHFRGVLTVVAKLFGVFAPDVAVFGQKDIQQSVLIRRMVEELDMGVDVRVAPIVREPDGLALSSRNVYLAAEERERALSLFRALEACRALFAGGEADAGRLREALRDALSVSGVKLEYAEVVDPSTLRPLDRAFPGAVCAVAARVGTTRLIDNTILGSHPC
jgi:pantoate--beta-alanine ligase